MTLVTIATLWNEHGPMFRIRSCDHPKHVFEAERASWTLLSAEVERRGCAPLTITETVEEAA